MLDCQSNLFRVKSTGFGGYSITNLKTNETKNLTNIPGFFPIRDMARTLARISEKEFDKLVGELFDNN